MYFNNRHLLVSRLTAAVYLYIFSDVDQVMLGCLVAVAVKRWKTSLEILVLLVKGFTQWLMVIIHVTDMCHITCSTCCLHSFYKAVGKCLKGTRETK